MSTFPWTPEQPSSVLVPPSGPKDAKIAFVGEAPGSSETAQLAPFVGMSGKLLEQMARQSGIMFRRCYLTNVVKLQPPKNDISQYIEFKAKGPIASPAYNEFEAQLYEELKEVEANVIVAVGGIALWALCRLQGITKRRGSIYASTQLAGRKVIPIIHPSSALREFLFRYHIAFDLRRVLEESQFPEVRLPERKIRIRPTLDEALEYLERANEGESVGFDIEVVNEEVSCFSVAITPLDVMSIPLSRGLDAYFTPQDELRVWRALRKLLENPMVRKVGQNIVFDSTFLLVRMGIRIFPVEDTMIGQGILMPDFPKGLDFITSVYTREPYYKDDGKKWFKMTGISEDAFWAYNAKDSAVCLEALKPIKEALEVQGNLETYNYQRDILGPLEYMHWRGIKVDRAGLQEAAIGTDHELEELQAKLNEVCEGPINPASTKQLKEYFYEKKKYKPYTNRATGNQSVDRDALKRLARKGDEAAKILMTMRKLQKLSGTYYQMKIDADDRIRCSFNPVGTTSGRLSSSKTIFGTGGNMQNLPPAMKRFLLADEGYAMYSIDLSQAENRVVAYTAPEPNMIHAFESGIDIHKQTASLIFGKPIDQISDEPGSSPIGGGEYSERFWGKKANHGLNYDLGYKTFAFYYEIPEPEAQFIVESYHHVYPGIRQYHRQVQSQLGKNNTLSNCFGRKRRFMGRWGDALFKEAYSFIPQSTVADIINQRGLIFVYENQDLFGPVELLNQVHDSIVYQLPLEIGFERHLEIAQRIVAELSRPLQWNSLTFSIPADTKVGVSLEQMSKVDLRKDSWALKEAYEKSAGVVESEEEFFYEEDETVDVEV